MKDASSQPSTCCPCGSGRQFEACCQSYVSVLNRQPFQQETILMSWIDRFSPPIQDSFRKKTQTLLFRISLYADVIFDFLCPVGFRAVADPEQQRQLDEAVRAIKHNVMLSLFGSLTCLAQGLFIQSGSLVRCCIEDSLVLLDFFTDETQLNRFLSGTYSASKVLTRVKRHIPDNLTRWYGHFSANFAHFGPFHSASYLPRACLPDNYVVGSGLENLLLATYMFHVVLERAHFDQLPKVFFWVQGADGLLEFSEDDRITKYVNKLQQEIISVFPPGERKDGYIYGPREYHTK